MKLLISLSLFVVLCLSAPSTPAWAWPTWPSFYQLINPVLVYNDCPTPPEGGWYPGWPGPSPDAPGFCAYLGPTPHDPSDNVITFEPAAYAASLANLCQTLAVYYDLGSQFGQGMTTTENGWSLTQWQAPGFFNNYPNTPVNNYYISAHKDRYNPANDWLTIRYEPRPPYDTIYPICFRWWVAGTTGWVQESP